jgi:hypothetical protein
LIKIVEFVDDSPANGRFDAGEEVSFYHSPKIWLPWTETVGQIGSAKIHNFTAATKDGVIRIIAHIASRTTGEFDVNGIKFDLEINNFPFKQSTSTGLAFITEIISDSRVEDGHRENTDGMHRRNAGGRHQDIKVIEQLAAVTGRFVWVDSIDITGNNRNDTVTVHAGTPKAKGRRHNYELNFWVNERADRYFWDPELKVDYKQDIDDSSSVASVRPWSFWM